MDSLRWKNVKNLFAEVLEAPVEQRQSLLAAADEDVRAEVKKLLDNFAGAERFIEQPAAVEFGAASKNGFEKIVGKYIDDYLIIEEIGTGGMGLVYLAEQKGDGLSHRVALKLIKRGMDTNSVLKRFVRERQILARLEHPYIARFLDGGSTEDGLPYFVMEFIDGRPIREYCEHKNLETKERLELFRKVCAAVSFAHQNLIVHRDLKPSNILVTDSGEPKLLDFGIAKLLNPDWSEDTREATATMFRVMTPDYASPEQLRGDKITTASDVYSLGVVLYELLTGTRPYKIENFSPENVAHEVLTHEPARPSSVVYENRSYGSATDRQETPETDKAAISRIRNREKRALEGDLDNIILKALQKEPGRRYSSVAEFSDDIRRHLEGLPVTAMADTFGYRLQKFIRRHRVGVATATAVLLILISTTSLTAWQAYRATRERTKAEQRFNQVRKLAHLVIFEYHDGIEKLVGSTTIREKMVRDAVEYLDNLSAEGSDDYDLKSELAAAYIKVGDVQGNPYLANLGDMEGSLASYQKANVIRSELAALRPDDQKTSFELEFTYEKLGEIYWAKGENQKSRENYEKSLAIAKRWEATGELLPADMYSFVRVNTRIGQTFEQIHEYEEAAANYRTAIAYGEKVLRAESENARFKRGLAVANLKAADVLHLMKKDPESLAFYHVALSVFEATTNKDPSNAGALRDYALCLGRVGLAQLESGQNAEALDTHKRTVQTLEQLITADPNNLQVKFDLADTYLNLGKNFDILNRKAEAKQTFQKALDIYRSNIEKNPGYAQARNHCGQAFSIYAKFILRMGDMNAAADNFKKALVILETDEAKKEMPDELADAYEGLGDAMFAMAARPQASEVYGKSLAVWQELKNAGKLADVNAERIEKIKQKLAKCNSSV